jgi:hypothetical protein
MPCTEFVPVLKHNGMKAYWVRFARILYLPRHKMELCGQRRVLAAFPPKEEPKYPFQ